MYIKTPLIHNIKRNSFNGVFCQMQVHLTYMCCAGALLDMSDEVTGLKTTIGNPRRLPRPHLYS